MTAAESKQRYGAAQVRHWLFVAVSCADHQYLQEIPCPSSHPPQLRSTPIGTPSRVGVAQSAPRRHRAAVCGHGLSNSD